MKKTLGAWTIAIWILFGTAGCGAAVPGPVDTIGLMELTDDQRQIVDLLSGADTRSYLFSFETEAAYANASFWLETYREGEKIDTQPIRIDCSYDEPGALRGGFSVTLTQGEGTGWSLVYLGEDRGKVTRTGVTERRQEWIASAWAALEPPCEIRNDEEIVLFACVFSEKPALEAFAVQDFLEPEVLKDYDCVHLLKCQFNQA